MERLAAETVAKWEMSNFLVDFQQAFHWYYENVFFPLLLFPFSCLKPDRERVR